MKINDKALVLFIQPVLMHYRIPVYNKVASKLRTVIVCSKGTVEHSVDKRFEIVEVLCISSILGLKWQKGLINLSLHYKPNVVWITADIHYISSIIFSFWCRIRGIKVILHGQGLVKHSANPKLRKILLKMWISICDIYIAYAEPCAESLFKENIQMNKVKVIPNRLEIDLSTVSPIQNFKKNRGVFFSGRIRLHSEINLLIEAMININKSIATPIPLHIVGDGNAITYLQNEYGKFSWLKWHGKITDSTELHRIAKNCTIGAYPGKAGLSIMTYIQEGLAVVVGNDITQHMGPEPCYIINGVHGWTFNPNISGDFERVLRNTIDNPLLPQVHKEVNKLFLEIHSKSYGEEMSECILHYIKETEPKIAVIWGKWGPYHYARFHTLVKLIKKDFCIGVALAGKSSEYAWSLFENSITQTKLYTANPEKEHEKLSPLIIGWQLYLFYRREKIDIAFLPSYWPASSLAILIAAKLAGVKCIMMNDSHAGTEKAKGITKWFKKKLINLFEAGFVAGTPQLKHFISFGMPKEKIFIGYDVIDNEYFIKKSNLVESRAQAIRCQLGLPQHYILNLGRMVYKKNLSLLIEAYALNNSSKASHALVLIGSGPEESNLRNLALKKGLLVKNLIAGQIPEHSANTVFFGGFRQIEENPAFYTLADVFVLPSIEEEWGLVVNEAMACKLPILVSKYAGCAIDLVKDGVNGYQFDPTDINEFNILLKNILSDTVLKESMGYKSREIIQNWGCELFATNAINSINTVSQ